MSNTAWHIVPDETGQAVVAFTTEYAGMQIKAEVKWDGCCNMWITENMSSFADEEEIEECYHHICNIDKFAEVMQQLAKLALMYFGDTVFCVGTVREDQIAPKITAFQFAEKTVDGTVASPRLLEGGKH